MEELQNSEGEVPRKLDPAAAQSMSIDKLELDEKTFRYLVNEDAMATEKTAEGIRKFAADMVKLEDLIREMLRPMLKAWLDENLPTVVERLVAREIARLARNKRF